MRIDHFLPKRVVVSLVIVGVIVTIGIFASQELGPRYLEWRDGKGEEPDASSNANTQRWTPTFQKIKTNLERDGMLAGGIRSGY